MSFIMGFLQTQMAQVVLVLVMFVLTPTLLAAPFPNFSFPVAKPLCVNRCGNISIPFPFGTTEDCYLNDYFLVTCNQTFNPPKLFLQRGNVDITDISLDGQLRVMQFIARHCYSQNGDRTFSNKPYIELSPYLTVNNTANKFTILGCDTFGLVSGRQLSQNNYKTGCIASCDSMDDLVEGLCEGLGCCQTAIPKHVWQVLLTLRNASEYNHTHVRDFNNCSYAFLVDETAFRFFPANLTNLHDVEKLPMVVDWAIGNTTCEKARNSSTYACKSGNSVCYDPTNGSGYRCSCKKGYHGNPYLNDGCQDIDECKDLKLNDCENKKYCRNTLGSFRCHCPKGYSGDGKKNAKGCNRDESLPYKLVAGIALGVVAALLVTCWLYLVLKRRKVSRKKRKYFLQNGGVLLQEKLSARDSLSVTVTIFTSVDLQKATNNFHSSMIIGRGGYGVVYKGLLTDDRIVAVKKSKEVDANQIEQFINEVIILSQINHRNVVKLLGCCLETRAPILVYEFISNGTLFEHIHNKSKTYSSLNWDLRLKIAIETAGVLSYLHTEASTPIIHRDVKSANILLDNTFTAKVSDFGASRLVPLDKTQLSTVVQGTYGYLDPEYMQTSQLTEKSDVYSFGVVLLELLTGMKVLSYDRPEDEINLSNLFLSMLKQERLFDILDDDIVCEENREQLIDVAMIAKGCLKMRGEDRPSMKEVAMELEGLRLGGKHSWTQTEENAEDMDSLHGERLEDFDNSC